MKKNKKSVSVKNTKSFLGNPPALANTTFFVPAANLNANDGIFTDLQDSPSNFSSSNQDPDYTFDLSNKIFSQSGKKKIFSDDKFKNMISYGQDTYTGDLFSDDFAPVRDSYEYVEREVSPVLAEINYPTNMTAEPQPISVGVAPIDRNYFAPVNDNYFATSMSYQQGDTFMDSDVLRQAQQSNSDFFLNREGNRIGDLLYQSDIDMPQTSISSDEFTNSDFSDVAQPSSRDNVLEASRSVGDFVLREGGEFQKIPIRLFENEVRRDNEFLRPEFVTADVINSYSDEDLLKLVGQEEFDRLVARRYQDAVLFSLPDSNETGDKKDPFLNTNNVPTASIQPITVEEDKKAKKPFNWLPIALVVAAVGGYMYYNRKK